MSVSLTLELPDSRTTSTIAHALRIYQAQLQASALRSKRKLTRFEEQYGVSTAIFLADMSAEDMNGGDMEYVEWAGEAQLLAGLESELEEIARVQRQLP